ncbi:MAG: conjugal transfer protein TraC [Candidatus Buchananbacteria bacterium RIFCSPHIGHO2_01_FULL_39_14]|uniref:Conjugal transfer protein TraC n=2 Tax=Candidatus Buchananiibacteriota TaxID=1817903 RepID=A0A1G1YUG6_9BACT|nr:MAG: conjugal transfer protein TraC [Candidatus Buchananbacteria bacterium RIFCSPHIGHO2_01_FULL_39_14]OGY48363.1 MAG: conjugal transfer protein TraC [Candidatus Buchananbacteria bacterium RIFCSPHIGHO2_02_FULL_39_17]OGY56003.1 MAG: conjugal transfer protein TraC [Candidatus Buchananbacteria bacterium RIFCSPLOWO2_01_FULL_40_23b]
MPGIVLPSKEISAQEKKELEAEKIILEEERIYREGVVSVKDLISPAALAVTPTFLKLGDKFLRTLFVISYPRYIAVGWFAPIINLSVTLDISMFFYPVKANIILKQLRNKVGALEAQILSDREKGAPRDPIRETALRDIEKLRDDLTQGVEHFFQFGLYVTLYANSKEELDNLTGDIESLFGSRLVFSKKVLYQAEQGFNSTLPLGNDELMIGFNMNSSPVASSFPFISSELTSDEGILYGINRHNNSLILFDRFSLQNANTVVFATSGAGKSYAIKLEVLRTLMFGTDVLVIDPEREYKHLCDAVGGTYINISLSSESKINPFDLPRPMGEQKTADIIRGSVITIKGLIRLMLGKLTHQEDSIIDRALLETYAKKDITSDSDLTKAEAPIMQDFQDVLEGMEGGADLSLRLKKYTQGTFAGLFNSPTNVDTKNQLVVFSVRDLEDELRPMAIYMIVNYIWNVVRSELKRRILIIDEAWWLMQNEDSAKFIYALVKRCRKYYLGVTNITQDVNDFLLSPYGQAIVNNSALQLLMRQSPAAIDLVQKTFLLTEGEKYLLLECGVGEGIFFAGDKHAAIKVVASYTEDQLITSDPRQILEIEEAKREFDRSMAARKEE